VHLERIASPADLKALGPDVLPELAEEIRSAIVAAVARSGGHLGPNLGVVELTIALHRALDSPRDRIVWDTGHQAYVHKMLTGRVADFTSLRTAGGLSGYPSREESEHDIVENSHASTALSWAAGLAWSQRHVPAAEQRRTIAVVGDGALTGGMAYEALNNIGHHDLPVTVVLNDNGRSYAETISRLSRRVSALRTDPRVLWLRSTIDRINARLPWSRFAARVTEANVRALKTAVSDAPALQSFVEALGVSYLGPFDGHDIADLERAMELARRVEGPVLVHVLTEKGKGYAPAERDIEKRLHDTSQFDPETGEVQSSSRRSWTAAFSDALVALAAAHPDVVAITAAMPGSTGLLPLARIDADRVIDVGIAEQHAVTSAAGLARAGSVPVLALYATFLARAFDQLNLDVGLHGEHVIIVLDRAGITGDDGPSHHGILDMALGLRVAGLSVLAPSCEEDLVELLDVAYGLAGPVLIRFPKGAVVARSSLGPRAEDVVPALSSRTLREGDDACVLAVGDRVSAALAAAERLAQDGIEVSVHDVRCVRPLDPALVERAAQAPFVVTVENGVVEGGAGMEAGARIRELVGPHRMPPILHLGVPTAHIAHGDPGRIVANLGLDAAGIAGSIARSLAAAGSPTPPGPVAPRH